MFAIIGGIVFMVIKILKTKKAYAASEGQRNALQKQVEDKKKLLEDIQA